MKEREGRVYNASTILIKFRSGQWGFFEPKSPVKGIPHVTEKKAFFNCPPTLNPCVRAAYPKHGLGADVAEVGTGTKREMGKCRDEDGGNWGGDWRPANSIMWL